MKEKTSYENRLSAVLHTPLGWAGVTASEQGICTILLPRATRAEAERALIAESPAVSTGRHADGLDRAVHLLRRYFAGEGVLFDLPLDLRYYTQFQRAVWSAAREVPYGETRSYGWIAGRIKRPRAARAVGQALGANPLPVIVPCHRVIGASGSLLGFSGSGGLSMKRTLLELERRRGKRTGSSGFGVGC